MTERINGGRECDVADVGGDQGNGGDQGGDAGQGDDQDQGQDQNQDENTARPTETAQEDGDAADAAIQGGDKEPQVLGSLKATRRGDAAAEDESGEQGADNGGEAVTPERTTPAANVPSAAGQPGSQGPSRRRATSPRRGRSCGRP